MPQILFNHHPPNLIANSTNDFNFKHIHSENGQLQRQNRSSRGDKEKKKKSSKRIFPLSHENMQANKEANEE